MKIILPFVTTSMILLSCGISDSEKEKIKNELRAELEENNSSPQIETENPISEAQPTYSFNPNASISRSPSQLAYEGAIQLTKTWQDKNGDNIALFTKRKDQIWVYHYAFPNGTPQLIRKVRDNEFDCEFDMSLNFMSRTIGVTDLDGDNLGELTFAYEKGCRSDMSALEMKLLMLENGDKYIIRGSQTMVVTNDFIDQGSKKIDPSFYNGPSVFLDHANYVWDQNERIVY